MMDPSYNQRDLRRSQLKNNNRYIQERNSGAPEYDEDGTPVNGNTAERGQEQQTARQPQHTDGFTMIPPNESRRSKLNMMAQKEEESFQRWKEANRPASVHINPEKLGGDMSFAEAREKQMAGLRGSKLQKKMKKEELDRRRRQEEEEALQRMKAVQREKLQRDVQLLSEALIVAHGLLQLCGRVIHSEDQSGLSPQTFSCCTMTSVEPEECSGRASGAEESTGGAEEEGVAQAGSPQDDREFSAEVGEDSPGSTGIQQRHTHVIQERCHGEFTDADGFQKCDRHEAGTEEGELSLPGQT
ncbi:epithelial-stromal interaction protein 1 isoform X2 [Cheilinus undulatus]|uniref:epithelial-stromal interaction protein 1 isoform X2 n=1 Tax=Cheilinus undulatus TaxID=241271 RepID=UPI001BD4E9F5|nr:epithelial-stromal interaction protein 1 isoform X2 [Cheilinus undulatus]